MDIANNNENIIFRFVFENPIYYNYVDKSFFNNKNLNIIIGISKKFYEKYKEIPTENQMLALFHNNDKLNVSDDIIKALYSIDTTSYDTEWLRNTTEAWIKWKHLNKQLVKGIEIAKTSDVNVDNVDDVVRSIVSTIDTSNEVNFNFNEGLDFFDATSHYQDTTNKISSGYQYIDTISGGYDEQTLVCYIGQSNIGKCVCGETIITIRNKKTNVILELPIEELYKLC